MNYARALYYARQFDDERHVIQEQLDQTPTCGRCLHLLGWLSVEQGKFPEGITMLEKKFADDKLYPAAALGYAYARAGRPDDAKRMFEILDKSPYPVPSHERALIFLGLGDRDQAFAYLNKSCDERFASIPLMSVDPLYDELRGDSRFVDLMKRANVPN